MRWPKNRDKVIEILVSDSIYLCDIISPSNNTFTRCICLNCINKLSRPPQPYKFTRSVLQLIRAECYYCQRITFLQACYITNVKPYNMAYNVAFNDGYMRDSKGDTIRVIND